MKRGGRGNVASLGHTRLITWGDRRAALGLTSKGPLSEPRVESQQKRSFTHADPTMACQIRDEPVYFCEKAVSQVWDTDPAIGQLLYDHYYKRQTERELATARGVTQRAIQQQLLSGQSQVGAILMFGLRRREVRDEEAMQ